MRIWLFRSIPWFCSALLGLLVSLTSVNAFVFSPIPATSTLVIEVRDDCRSYNQGNMTVTEYCRDGYVCDDETGKCKAGPELQRDIDEQRTALDATRTKLEDFANELEKIAKEAERPALEEKRTGQSAPTLSRAELMKRDNEAIQDWLTKLQHQETYEQMIDAIEQAMNQEGTEGPMQAIGKMAKGLMKSKGICDSVCEADEDARRTAKSALLLEIAEQQRRARQQDAAIGAK